MEVSISDKLYTASGGEKAFKAAGLPHKYYTYQKGLKIELSTLDGKKLEALVGLITPNKSIHGASLALRDIQTWIAALDGKDVAKPRSVENFSTLLKLFVKQQPGHRLYTRAAPNLAFYVHQVKYHPPDTRRDYTYPAYTALHLAYVEFGCVRTKTRNFFAADCIGMVVEESLARAGFTKEDEELRANYLASNAKFIELHDKIGLQLQGVGTATDNLDGNDDDADERSARGWNSWRGSSRIVLDSDGRPARLLVDVYKEKAASSDDKDEQINYFYWEHFKPGKKKRSDDDEDEEDYDDVVVENEAGERPLPEIPVHPTLPCFDLRRHLRLRVNVDNVTVYKYDTSLADKLVLPPEVSRLIEVLISSKHSFTDVIQDKGGGTSILCAGPAGVGKTLTAEVYSETKERPLYSVQCSQLGITPEELEQSLYKVFARAQRWNAILLLDEADVYIMKRGRDLNQNAIVGVFLRVLEYYSGTLFMTTNRSGMVDDAIASRCIARIDYKVPLIKDQRKLWRILSIAAGCPIPTAVIQDVLKKGHCDSGRDIKNLIKLAKTVSTATGEPITFETIEYVRQFKPTSTQAKNGQESNDDDGRGDDD